MHNSKIAIICGYVFIAIFSLCKGFALNEGTKIYYVLAFISLFPLVYKCMNTKFSNDYLSVVIPLFTILLIISIVTNRMTLLLTIALIVCAKDLSAKGIAKTVFLTRAASFLIMVLLSLFGIIPNNNILFLRGEGLINRASFGYTHPNEVFINIFIIISSGLLSLNGKKKKNIAGLISAAVCIGFYFLTKSRTGFIISEAFIAIYLFIINFEPDEEVMKKTVPVIIFAPVALTFIISLLYGHIEFVEWLDELLTGRIEYNYNIITNMPITLLGNTTDIVKGYGFNFDNSFLKVLYYYGVVAFIVFMGYIYYFAKRLLVHKNYEILVVFILTLFYGLTESYLDNAILNYAMLFISAVIVEKEWEIYEE